MCMFLKFVPAGVPVALDFLTDLANLWSVECVGNSYCILDGYSRELIHASACVGLVESLPCFCPSLLSFTAALHTYIRTHAILIKVPLSNQMQCGVM